MRTKYSFFNMLVGVGGQVLGALLAFLARMVFIRYLSVEYLGVNGLFSNILGMLSLAELGIGSAMVFSMYKPAAEDDRETICRLMNLYRNLYYCVALVILILGLVLLPFLDYFIKGETGVGNLRLIYLMYLVNSVSSYLFSYKNSIFIANQKAYVKIMYEQVFHIVQILVQILVLMLTKNFILYLAVQMVELMAVNILVARRADKEYPYLNIHKNLPDREERGVIFKNIMAMSMHRMGGVFVNGTDNILMSAFVGLASVGIYSNYKLILLNIEYIMNRIYSAFSGSIGNLGATEDWEKVYEVYRILDFFMAWIYGFLAVELVIMFNPFIELFFGREYLFSLPVVLLFVSGFYFNGVRQMNLQFKDAMGLFWHDRYKPLGEVSVNLVVSLILARKIGVTGIFIGTLVSCLGVCFWIEPYVLMRYGMKERWQEKLRTYFLKSALRVLLVSGTGAVCYKVCERIPGDNFGWLIVKGSACALLYGVFTFVILRKCWEFKKMKERIKHVFSRVLKSRK